MRILKAIDFYGLKSELMIEGKYAFKTALGGIFSFLTVIMLGLLSFLFGRDFWLKTNPKVVTREILLDKSELVPVNSLNFTVFYRVEDIFTNIVEDPDRIIAPYFFYQHYKRDSNKNFQLKAYIRTHGKKCSETAAKNNSDLPNIDLDSHYCIDWEEIAEQLSTPETPYQPVIGGTWEEDEIGILTVGVSNYRFKPDGTLYLEDHKKILDFLTNNLTYIVVGYPESYFDSSLLKNSFKRYWKLNHTIISAVLAKLDRCLLKISVLEDDNGWIFESIDSSSAISKAGDSAEVDAFNGNSTGELAHYAFIIQIQKIRTIYRRSYMKIQEVAALLGGFLKGIQVIFSFVAQTYAKYKRIVFLGHVSKKTQMSGTNPNKSTSILNNFVKTTEMNSKIQPRVKDFASFWSILFRFLVRKKSLFVSFDESKAGLENALDTSNLIKLYRRIELVETKLRLNH